MEDAIIAGDGETVEGPVLGNEAAFRMGEVDAEGGRLRVEGFEERTLVREFAMVDVGPGEEGEAEADVPFIFGVDIFGLADVDCDGKVRVGEFGGAGLGFTDLGPGAFSGDRAALRVAGELDDEEGEVAKFPIGSPLGDEGFEDRGVWVGAARVGFVLVPGGAANCEIEKGVDHAVIEGGEGDGVFRGARGKREFDFEFPEAGEGLGIGAGGERKLIAFSAESASAPLVEDAHGEEVSAGLEEFGGDGVEARGDGGGGVVGPDGADECAVEIGVVKVVKGTEGKLEVTIQPGRREVDFAAEPDGTVDVEAGGLPVAGEIHGFPGGVVVRMVGVAEGDAGVARILMG